MNFPGYHLLILLLISLIPAQIAAQGTDSGILQEIRIFDRFSHITDVDRELEVDHSSPYEYMLRNATIRISDEGPGILAQIDHLIRIRVLTDDPIYQAQAGLIGIPYYFDQDMERVRNLEGRVHQPDGSFRVVDDSDARHVELNSRYRILELEMPDVEEGSIIEYKYTLERRYIEELPDFYFSHRVPVREANLYLKNEHFLRYETIEENIDFEYKYEEHRVDTSNVPMVFTYERPDPVYIQSWHARDVPEIDASSYISSFDDIRGKLRFQISEFGIPRQPLENSWEFVAAQIYRNIEPMEIVENHPELLALGDSLYQDVDDLISRQDSIFNYLNSRMQFNESSAVFTEGSINHVLNGDPADQAEINMTLLTLLKGAGYDVRPLYISGREFGRINKSFPSLYQFNRMLVTTRIDGRDYIMDGSYSHSMPGLIPPESLNQQGMALSGREYEWIDLIPDESIFRMEIRIDADLREDGDLYGKISAVTEGYPSRLISREQSRGVASDDIAWETFFDVYTDAEVTNTQIVTRSDNWNKAEVRADFHIPQYSVTFSDGMEYRPMVVGYLFSNPFEETSRRAPVTLDAPENLEFHYSIKLPEHFETETGGGTNATSLRGAELIEEYLSDGNTLEYSFTIDISRKEFEAGEYAQLRRLYERWVSLSNENWFITNLQQ